MLPDSSSRFKIREYLASLYRNRRSNFVHFFLVLVIDKKRLKNVVFQNVSTLEKFVERNITIYKRYNVMIN